MSIFADTTPPDGLGPRGRACWMRLFDAAARVYATQIPDYGLDDAKLTATVGAKAWYQGSSLRRMPSLSRFPDPGDLVTLGTFIEIDFAQPSGRIDAVGWEERDGVPLWWSPSLKACFVYPRLMASSCSSSPTRRERRLVQTWTDGNYDAACVAHGKVPTPAVHEVYPALAITYVSVKFSSSGEKTRYIHHDGPGVHVYMSTGAGAGNRRGPEAIMLRGGKLRLTKDGLDG